MAFFGGADSRFARITSRIEELLILNVLFIVYSLPIFTLGASATALYTVLLRLLRGETGRVGREFRRAFRENFRQATVLWLILLAIGIILYFDLRISNQLPGTLGFALRVAFWIFIVLHFSTLSYVFAVQARFDNPVRRTLWNSFWMAMGNLPFTISVLVFELLPTALICLRPQLQGRLLPVFLLIGPSVQCMGCAVVFQHIFSAYIPKEEEQND